MCIKELVELGKEKYKHQYSTTPAPLPGKVTSEFISRVPFSHLSCFIGLHDQKVVASFGLVDTFWQEVPEEMYAFWTCKLVD